MAHIQLVTEGTANYIIEHWDDPEKSENLKGNYLLEQADGTYTAIENLGVGACLVEDFATKELAEGWLRHDFEASDLYDATRITNQ